MNNIKAEIDNWIGRLYFVDWQGTPEQRKVLKEVVLTKKAKTQLLQLFERREKMSKHNFIESTDKFGEFKRVIYCTWCGVVVWDWNKNEDTKIKQSDLQKHVGKPCVAQSEETQEED